MMRAKQTSLFQKNLAARQLQTVAGKNYLVPEDVQDVIKSLDKQRPTFTCLYFSAAWNPVCAQIERDYENLTNSRGEFMHLRVDCDKTPLVKRYFDARVEPQFVFLINGGEVARVIGYNFAKVEETATNLVTAHTNDEFGYYGSSGQ